MIEIESLNQKHTKQLHKLYQNEWWTDERTLEKTEKVVENSSIVIGLTNEEDDLIAFARLLTDFTFKAIIFDVIVEKSLRHEGLGKKLMDLIVHHKKLQDVKHFELYCRPEMVPFYKAYGFEDDLNELVFMRKMKLS